MIHDEMTKTYLGDSVYAEFNNGMIKLTTENGYGPSNTTYLEFEVFHALLKYVKDLTEQMAAK